MELKSLIESKTAGKIVLTVFILAIAFAIFQAGIFVGFRKSSFMSNYGDNYYRNFGGQNFKGDRGGRMMMDIGGHGVTGRIIKVESDRILVLGDDNIEKIINISSTTKIYERRNQMKVTDLKPDQSIVTIGNPDANGQINANFIRVMPLILNK